MTGQTPLALSSRRNISIPARNRGEQMPLLGRPDGWVAAKGIKKDRSLRQLSSDQSKVSNDLHKPT